MNIKMYKKNKLKFLIVGVAGLLLLGMSSHIKVVEYDIQSSKVDEPVKMVLITDLHSCNYGENQIELIEAVDQQTPDIVLLSGDIFDDHMDNDRTVMTLKALSNSYPCYYVTGNHEIWSGEVDNMKKIMEDLGIHVLEGENEIVTIGDQRINVCGVDDPEINNYTNGHSSFESQLENLKHIHENGLYTILLSHRPEYVGTYANYSFDLILAGHAHGGQWRLPGIINGLYAPGEGLFPKYAGGRYTFLSSEMIVSRGLAKESTRVPRIFNRPELVVINLN